MNFENISINEALDAMSRTGGVLIDVRDPEDYDEGHLPCAINVPYEKIERGLFNVNANVPLILYCERGGKSMLASKYLSRKGYQIINVIGGIMQYRGELEILN